MFIGATSIGQNQRDTIAGCIQRKHPAWCELRKRRDNAEGAAAGRFERMNGA
jgi:hypothetical protein